MSTEPERNSKWNKLVSFPFPIFSQPLIVHNDEFVVAAASIPFYCDGDGIYKFNIHKNEWKKIFYYDSATYNNKHKLLHICDRHRWPCKMLTFDLKTKSKVTSDIDFRSRSTLNNFRLIFVEDKLHKICIQDGGHYIHNKTKQFQRLTSFKSFATLGNRLIYLQTQNSILSFGGSKTLNGCYSDSIYRFSCMDLKWEELNIKIPIKLSAFGLIATKNEQYIIILGGQTPYTHSDVICIYDTRNNVFTKSKMKCPTKGSYYAIMMNNSISDELLCFGFVNHCYQTETFVGIQVLPQYLIKIICCYYCHEEIYLLKIGTGHGEHWKINLDHVL